MEGRSPAILRQERKITCIYWYQNCSALHLIITHTPSKVHSGAVAKIHIGQPQIGHKHHYRQQKPAVCHHDTYISNVYMLRCQMFLLNVGRVSYNERNTCKSSPWLLWKHLFRLFFFLPSQRSDDILMTARLFRPRHTKYEDATVHRSVRSYWGDKRRPWLPIWFIFYGENVFLCVCVCLRSDVLRLFCHRCLYLLLKITSNCCRLVVSTISPAGCGPIRWPRASKPANWAN